MVRQLPIRHFAVNHIPPTLDRRGVPPHAAARPARDLVRARRPWRPGAARARRRLARDAAGDDGRASRRRRPSAASTSSSRRAARPAATAAASAPWRWCPRWWTRSSPIPVVAAGGIFDGRGIAAALMLGAVGVNLGTRFLASKEAPISEEWKQAIVGARSEDAVKADVLNDITPLPGTAGFGTVLRSLARHSWRSGGPSARRRAAIATACAITWCRRTRPAGSTTRCSPQARQREASGTSRPLPRSCGGWWPRPRQRWRERPRRVEAHDAECVRQKWSGCPRR